MATAQTYKGEMSGSFFLKDQDDGVLKKLDFNGSIAAKDSTASGTKLIAADTASQTLNLEGISLISAFAWRAYDVTTGLSRGVTLEFTHGGGDKSLSLTSEGHFIVGEGTPLISGIKVTTPSGNNTVLEYAVVGS